MKTIRIKSNTFKDGKFKFDSFAVIFDKFGVAEIEVKNEEEEALLERTISSYDSIYYLEDSANQELESEKKQNIAYLTKVIDSQKEEIKSLEIANQEQAVEIIQLKTEVKLLRKSNNSISPKEEIKPLSNKKVVAKEESKVAPIEEKEEIVNTVSEEVIDETSITKEIKENTKIYEELNKKTIPQLKEILEETFADFKEEWVSIAKKDNIVAYILNKTISA